MANIASDQQLSFHGLNDFKPWYSAQDMLELGVFGGDYFADLDSRTFGVKTLEAIAENKWRNVHHDPSINYFGLDEPQLLAGKIDLPRSVRKLHPHGWFQWYMGVCTGNELKAANPFRIQQWVVDVKTLWWYIESNPTDLNYRPDIRQGLLSRAWDSTKNPYDYGFKRLK